MASSLVRRSFRLSSSLFARRSSIVARATPIFCTSFCNCPRCYPVRKTTSFRSSIAPNGVARSFSSSKVGADENLKKVLHSEIKEANDIAESQDQQYPMPEDFKFSIHDKCGEQTITMERIHHGETIKAVVFLHLEDDEDDDEGKDENDQNDEHDNLQSSISMVVTIDKGEDSFVEFCCSMNPEEIVIENMAIKKHDASDDHELYSGPPFSDLDENLQNEFYRYLEVRGISNSLFGFLQDYMVKKDEREYITWLKNLKNFVES